MVKKTRKEKELSRLRREIEILKAQARLDSESARQASGKNYSPKTPPPGPGETSPEAKLDSVGPPLGDGTAPLKALEIRRVDPKYIKKGLLKTALLSLLALAVILVLYLLRGQIPFL